MYIKESVKKLIIILLVIIFGGTLFLTITFLKKEAQKATSPSTEVIKQNTQFDESAYKKVLEKLE